MNPDAYLRLVEWARKRYARDGRIIITIGGKPASYAKVEAYAWAKYMEGRS